MTDEPSDQPSQVAIAMRKLHVGASPEYPGRVVIISDSDRPDSVVVPVPPSFAECLREILRSPSAVMKLAEMLEGFAREVRGGEVVSLLPVTPVTDPAKLRRLNS